MRITFQDMIGAYRKRKAFGHHVKYFFSVFYFQIILSMKKEETKVGVCLNSCLQVGCTVAVA